MSGPLAGQLVFRPPRTADYQEKQKPPRDKGMKEIIITDLTRFKDVDHVCVAGLTLDGQVCIRPMKAKTQGNSHPYLTYEQCKSNGIFPGTVVKADFTASCGVHAPHVEDQHFRELKIIRRSTSDEFRDVLSNSACATPTRGFGVKVDTKLIPFDGPVPQKSIVTLKISPQRFTISHDYDKLRANLVDSSGVSQKNLPVTDLRYVDFFKTHSNRQLAALKINSHFRSQSEIFVRIGLTRPYAAPDGRHGYWLQINGIYSFPDIWNGFDEV